MPDYELHEPQLSGTTTGEWDDPQLEEFDTDDLGEVADSFLLSASGFPPENFTDLKLPVVDQDGNLNRNALRTAKSGGRGVGAVEDLDARKADEVEDLIDELANEHFDDADFGD
ncbi:hypothetical protein CHINAEXTREME_03680 [Halobiforma lacisalsi AJ5]|uniref:Uncharacterized protein n=1 Tax=Natronobacterium lacisalsi AJ5 TaxID=358396 RepID=M0LQA8_NATLA|nr:hypothetical protein [Halobiforma lacisalsi]APW96924.1 hypothetical protein CHINAEXTREME_03680 [Halobiforma lacisalsi AJ5]EMA34634.1 hypothetical protein C445_06920 [Halobiforma lacisalsi AJ5]